MNWLLLVHQSCEFSYRAAKQVVARCAYVNVLMLMCLTWHCVSCRVTTAHGRISTLRRYIVQPYSDVWQLDPDIWMWSLKQAPLNICLLTLKDQKLVATMSKYLRGAIQIYSKKVAKRRTQFRALMTFLIIKSFIRQKHQSFSNIWLLKCGNLLLFSVNVLSFGPLGD